MTWTDGKMAPVGKDSSLKTWKGDQWKIGGGTTWGWYSYDKALNLVYYGTGNPSHLEPGAAPRRQQVVDDDLRARRRHRHGEVGLPDDAVRRVGLRRRQRDDPGRHQRQGQADQGAGALRPQRLRLHAGPRHRRAAGGREVRPDGQLGDARRHEDRPAAGGGQVLDRARTGPDVNTKGICPAALGTKDQQPAAFDPETKLFYVPTNHVCMDYEPFKVEYTAGQPYVGATLSMYPAPGSHGGMGNFITWDAGTGKIVQSPSPRSSRCGAARSNTAGGISCYGTLEGYLKCVDAKRHHQGAVQVQDAVRASSATCSPMSTRASSTSACSRASAAGPASAWRRASTREGHRRPRRGGRLQGAEPSTPNSAASLTVFALP